MSETAVEDTLPTAKTTTLAASMPLARMIGELADDAGIRIRDWLDREFSAVVREKYAAMLDRKLAELNAHELGTPVA